MSSEGFSLISSPSLDDDLVIPGPRCDMPEMSLTSGDDDKPPAEETNAISTMGLDPGLTGSGISWIPHYSVGVSSSWCGPTRWKEYDSVRDGDTLAINEGGWKAEGGHHPPVNPDSFPHAQKPDNYRSGRTPRAAKTRKRPVSFDDLDNRYEYCGPLIDMNSALDGPIWGKEAEALGDVENQPTTGSNSALCSLCYAKPARKTEGRRSPFRRNFRWHLRPPPRSHVRRLATRFSDCVFVLTGGLATVVIVNFNQALGTCPAFEDDHRWPTMLLPPRYLPPSLRCPSPPLYAVAICAYSAAGVVQIVREPKYWADCALVAVLAALITGAVYGMRSMVDALVIGGFLSLLCCKGIVWSMRKGESQLPG